MNALFAALAIVGGFLALVWVVCRRSNDLDAAVQQLSCGCPRDGRPRYGHLYCSWVSCDLHRGVGHDCATGRAVDPVAAHFATALREFDYTPAASLTADEIATLADLERRLAAADVPYVPGFPTAEGDPK